MRCKMCLQEKRAEDFYASNRARCKECIKASVRQNRLDKLEYYRQFDRQRASQPERVAARLKYQQTTEGRIASSAAKKRWIVANTIRRQAHNKLAAAIKSGRVSPQLCFVCGAEAQAHHSDYENAIGVTWLCPQHHSQLHREFRDLQRGQCASAAAL